MPLAETCQRAVARRVQDMNAAFPTSVPTGSAQAPSPGRSAAASAPSGAFEAMVAEAAASESASGPAAVLQPQVGLAAPTGATETDEAEAGAVLPGGKPKRKTDQEAATIAALVSTPQPAPAVAANPAAAQAAAGKPVEAVTAPAPSAGVEAPAGDADIAAAAGSPPSKDPSAAAALGAAGVTAITGESSAAAPKLDTPAALKPPGAEGTGTKPATTDGKDAKDAKAAAGAKPAGEPKAPASAADDAKDSAASAPDEDAAQQAGPDARQPSPGAEHRAASQLAQNQTPAAPATPSAQNPQAASGAAAAAQVANEIAQHAGSRRTRFEVRLDPGELGRIDVRLDIGHDGRISTRLIVERPETLDMLRNDARDLTRSLENAGFQLGQGGLAFQLKQGGREAFPQRDGGAGSTAAEDGEIKDVAAVASPYRRPSPAGVGGVDMTV